MYSGMLYGYVYLFHFFDFQELCMQVGVVYAGVMWCSYASMWCLYDCVFWGMEESILHEHLGV